MLRRCVLAFVLTAGSAAWAAPADVTTTAETSAATADKAAAQVTAKRAGLAAHYAEQTAAIDKIKQQKPSWRRDRELRAALADAEDTGKQLAAATRDESAANAKVAEARKAAVAAIDAELAAAPAAPRAQQLTAERARLAPASGPAGVHKIVIPNSDLDPLADPEDLDKEASALRQTEAELQHQVEDLDRQSTALKQSADARKEHNRAVDLAVRDDDTPHRGGPGTRSTGAASLSGNGTGTTATPTQGGGAGGSAPGGNDSANGESGGGGAAASHYESDATIALADVVDSTTIDSLSRAQHSGDPTQRAAAAKQARDAVAARLAQLRAKRAAVEARAKQLRTTH
jgi:hypothetical protein